MSTPRCPSCGKLLIKEINNEVVKCSDCLCTITWISYEDWKAFEEWEEKQEILEAKFRKDSKY